MYDFVWHSHHQGVSPLSSLISGLDDRLEFIRSNKPAVELETRLRFIKKVVGDLPEEFIIKHDKALFDYKAAEHIHDYEGMRKAFEIYGKVLKEYEEEILKLHAIECGCNWTPENNNIFDLIKPQLEVQGVSALNG